MNASGISWFKRVLGFGPYFRRRSNALEGMAVASFLGVTSGIYIWKPIIEEMQVNRANRELEERNASSEDNKD